MKSKEKKVLLIVSQKRCDKHPPVHVKHCSQTHLVLVNHCYQTLPQLVKGQRLFTLKICKLLRR